MRRTLERCEAEEVNHLAELCEVVDGILDSLGRGAEGILQLDLEYGVA